jgi:hypothetical protein
MLDLLEWWKVENKLKFVLSLKKSKRPFTVIGMLLKNRRIERYKI